MSGQGRPPLDPLTQASVTVAWVIVLNKPLYPLYVWYLVGTGVIASFGSVIAAPFFLAIPFLARHSGLTARITLPLVGTVDTWFETKLFGAASGTELFFAACILLVTLSFRAGEVWWQRGMAVFVFLVFVLSRSWIGLPLHSWNTDESSALLQINAFAVASLTTFIALRYAGTVRETESNSGDHS